MKSDYRDNILQVISDFYEKKVIIDYNEANCAISDGEKNASLRDCITILPLKKRRKVQSVLRNNNEDEE